MARMETSQQLRESLLEAQAEAALGGHELEPFQAVDTISGGYEARCKLCQMTTWVGENGLRYSLLEDRCKGARDGSKSLF